MDQRWYRSSPLHQHMQHQSTLEKPLLLKLSPVIIFPHTADHTKKETRPHMHIGNSWNGFKNLLHKEWVLFYILYILSYKFIWHVWWEECKICCMKLVGQTQFGGQVWSMIIDVLDKLQLFDGMIWSKT